MAKDISTTIVLKVSGKEAENSFQGLNKLVKGLEAELRKLTPGTEEFMKKAAEVKEARRHFEQVKNEINSVNQKIDESGNKVGFIRRNLLQVGDTFRQVFTANIAGNFFEMFISKGSQATDELLKISDAMSDVQKTTGMTLGEVKELWDAFDEMDTRTSKLDRLKIAEEAGRLGVPKEQMREFVQEIDKVNVALGDSFKGGLEEIVGSLGKIKGLFEETKGKTYALAINEVGSAMNELSASGTASEGNIADFTLRVGALPDALKPSIDKVLGLGAAFEESGLDSQIAASGYTNFMKVAGENLEAFAYSMNMSIEEARELFNTRPEEFFLRFSEGMRGLSADETAKVFDSLKLNSLEVQKAVGAAANRTDVFREAMERAGGAMSEATSLQDEFNTKNQNAAAIWQKLKNAFADIFTQTNIINSFEWLIKLIGGLLGITSETANGVNALKERLSLMWSVIKVLTASLIGYNVATTMTLALEGNLTKAKWLGIVADKAQIAYLALKKSATYLLAYAQLALEGNITRAAAAQRLFNRAINANPVGLFIGAVITATAVMTKFLEETNNTTESQTQLNQIQEEAIKTAAKETAELDKLYKAATDASKGKDAQREAVEKLQRLYPSYFGNMDAELIMLGKAEQKYKDLKEAILASARAKAAESIIKENTENALNWLKKTIGIFRK